MTQTIRVNGNYPRTKKALRTAIGHNPEQVLLESHAVVPGEEYSGPITAMPVGRRVYLVGPEPYVRRWYGQLTKRADGTFLLS